MLLFCVVVVITNAFCCHSSGYCPLLPPRPQRTQEPGGAGGAEGVSQQNHSHLLSSHSETGLDCVNESRTTAAVQGVRARALGEELLGELRRAKFSSPKPPRASVKTSGFMKVWRVLAREGTGAWPGPSPPAREWFLAGPPGSLCFGWFSVAVAALAHKVDPDHLAKQRGSLAPAAAGGPTQEGLVGSLSPPVW